MAVYNNILAGASGAGVADYKISRSLRFSDTDQAYLNRTPSSAGNQKTWTWSGWVKRSGLSTGQNIFGSNNQWFELQFKASTDQLQIYWESSGTGSNYLISDAVFVDPSAFLHIFLKVDTTQSTAADRIQVYVNGTIITWSSATYPSQNYDTGVNSANPHGIGIRVSGTALPFDGYIADVQFTDGVSGLTASDFGEFDDNNVWQAKKYSGSYGTNNGFHLDFSDNSSASALGTDAAGSNNWTPNNFSVAAGAGNDSLIDTPTNITADSGNNPGNYATLNPLDSALTGLNNGNLNSGASGAASWKICTSTIAVSSGKYYWEGFTTISAGASGGWQWGFCQVGPSSLTTPYGTGKWSYQHGTVYSQSSSGTAVGTTAVANDVLAYALDMDAGTCKLYVNNSLVHTFTGVTGTITPFVASYYLPTVTVNFGQRPFAYTPPTGYKSLCTTNLPQPTIADGSTAFDVKLFTGNHPTGQSITGLNFSPDFVWLKDRASTNWHYLFDAIRGTEKGIFSNATNAEGTYANTLTAFNSDGFTLGSDNATNQNGNAYVAWAWDAGSSTVSNTDGSITSSVRASPSSGCSIVNWTGQSSGSATIGHGLNAAPEFIIVKALTGSVGWTVGHNSIGWTKRLKLNGNDAESTSSNYWNDTAPTSSVFTSGANNVSNTFVAYCFAPVEGFSAFGSYTGNGSADGPFVYTGMLVSWVLIKRSDGGSENWTIWDTARNEFNVMGKQLYPNLSSAEADAGTNSAYGILDCVSNGFKIRGSHSSFNVNAGEFIYAAFAEHPFKTARAR